MKCHAYRAQLEEGKILNESSSRIRQVLSDTDRRRLYDERIASGQSEPWKSPSPLRGDYGGQEFKDVIGDVRTLPYTRAILFGDCIASVSLCSTVAGWLAGAGCSSLWATEIAISTTTCVGEWLCLLLATARCWRGRCSDSAAPLNDLREHLSSELGARLGTGAGRAAAGPLGRFLGGLAGRWAGARAMRRALGPPSGEAEAERRLAEALRWELEDGGMDCKARAAYADTCRREARRLLAAGGPALLRTVGIVYAEAGAARAQLMKMGAGVGTRLALAAREWRRAAGEWAAAEALRLAYQGGEFAKVVIDCIVSPLSAGAARQLRNSMWDNFLLKSLVEERAILYEVQERLLRVCELVLQGRDEGPVQEKAGRLAARARALELVSARCLHVS